jgi:hypothetical protein
LSNKILNVAPSGVIAKSDDPDGQPLPAIAGALKKTVLLLGAAIVDCAAVSAKRVAAIKVLNLFMSEMSFAFYLKCVFV